MSYKLWGTLGKAWMAWFLFFWCSPLALINPWRCCRNYIYENFNFWVANMILVVIQTKLTQNFWGAPQKVWMNWCPTLSGGMALDLKTLGLNQRRQAWSNFSVCCVFLFLSKSFFFEKNLQPSPSCVTFSWRNPFIHSVDVSLQNWP